MCQVRGGGGHRQEGAQGGHDAARGGPRPRPPQCPRRRAVRRVGPPREHGLTRPGPARAWHEPALSGVAELRASSASAPSLLFGWARPIGMVGTRPARRITGITGAPLGGCGRAGWRRWGGHCGVFGGGSSCGSNGDAERRMRAGVQAARLALLGRGALGLLLELGPRSRRPWSGLPRVTGAASVADGRVAARAVEEPGTDTREAAWPPWYLRPPDQAQAAHPGEVWRLAGLRSARGTFGRHRAPTSDLFDRGEAWRT